MSARFIFLSVVLAARSLAFPQGRAAPESSNAVAPTSSAVAVEAAPTANSAIPIPEADVGNLIVAAAAPSDICALPENDPASWGLSGASEFMTNWFNANGSDNWLAAMVDGSSDSTLSCNALGGPSCGPPRDSCESSNPPVLRYIRIAAAKAASQLSDPLALNHAHEQLQDSTIVNTLAIDALVADFAPDGETREPFNAIAALNSGVGLASGLLSVSAGPGGAAVGARLSAIGGVLTFADEVILKPAEPIDSTEQWTQVVSAQLSEMFSTTQGFLKGVNDKLFGGSSAFDLRDLVERLQTSGQLPNDGLDPIVQNFKDGSFLGDPVASTLGFAFTDGLDRVKHSLIANLFRGQNFYVFIDTTIAPENCGTFGNRLVNGQCAMLSHRDRSTGGAGSTTPVSAEIMAKLEDESLGYNVNLQQMYDNAVDCNSQQLDTSVILGDGYPKCFWSLPVVGVDGPDVCLLLKVGMAAAEGIAAGLGIIRARCEGDS